MPPGRRPTRWRAGSRPLAGEISPTAAHCASFHALSAPASAARSANSRTAALWSSASLVADGSGVSSERTRTTRSPSTPNASRLVATRRPPGHFLDHRLRERARLVEEMLTVVEHHQQLTQLRVLDDAVRQRQPRPCARTDVVATTCAIVTIAWTPGRRTTPRPRIGPAPRPRPASQGGSSPHRRCRSTSPASAFRQHLDDLGDVVVTTHERRHLRGQVPGKRIQ